MSLNDKVKIICTGEDFLEHPKIYITFKKKAKEVKCGYCGKVFKKSDYECRHSHDKKLNIDEFKKV